MTTRHEFLGQLHELLQPKTYLEIGVQHGWSLQLSKAELSIGIDPKPLVKLEQLNMPHETHLAHMTSDEFFSQAKDGPALMNLEDRKIDLAFIDGMHLAEFAWRDFINVSKYCNGYSVVVFDDVLPTTQEMASRAQCPGDWTGDVWKVWGRLIDNTDLVVVLVDTQPTGTMVVTGFDDQYFKYTDILERGNSDFDWLMDYPVPKYILDRRHAWSAPAVIENLKDRNFGA